MKLSVPALLVSLSLAVLSTPADAHSRRSYTPPVGYVSVDNHAGVPVTVTVEGSGARVVGAWETVRFATHEGEISVVATYSQYGNTYSLTSREVRVHGRRTTALTIGAPESGKVKVVNDTGVAASVFVGGRSYASLSPGASRILTVPLGKAELTMFANGVLVESACVEVRPFSEKTLVAEAPAFADLVVSNPLPFAVDVMVDHGSKHRVAANSSTVLPHVRVGRVEVEYERLGGYAIDEELVNVRAWSGAEMTVNTPRTGLVRLDSDACEFVRVFIDGRLVSLIEPFAETTLLLPLGPTVLEVRKLEGTLVERSYVVVDPLRTTSLDFGRREGDRRVSERDHDGHHDEGRGDDGEGHRRPSTW